MIDEMNFRADGCEFSVHKDDESFIVRAKSESPLPKHFETRVEEALRFLLAQSVQTRVLVQGAWLELSSDTPRSRRTALNPPIARGSHALVGQSWDLFAQYLGYVLRETKHPYWNPCGGYLHNALESSANSLDAWAIGLCVAVEGLAAMLPLERDKQETSKLKALQRFIIDEVTAVAEYKQFAARIPGLVGGLTAIRAVDRLTSLALRGHTDIKYIEAWKKLRNRGVHPTTGGKNDIASLDFQRLIDELHRVNVLLYHIVFDLIGYCGPYTDYATRGFPITEYPPAAARASRPDKSVNVPTIS